MSLKVGIVGLPNAGKSTLFNALLKKQQALAANYPFTTIEPNIGVVPVPDPRLEQLEQTIRAHEKLSPDFQITPATIKFVDIAGLVEGAHQGEGLGNRFLAHIRETDAIILLARRFPEESVAWVGPKEAEQQFNILENELKEAEITKPFLKVVNTTTPSTSNEVLFINALQGMGVDELIQRAYQLLGLITFYSYNEKELRAWPILKGALAPQAAGEVHTDFMKGFIRAEVVAYDDLIAYKGWSSAKAAGKVRSEGKDYIVKDGDIILFRFNV